MRSAISLLASASLAAAATKTFDWEVTWVQGAPNGFNRPIVGVNGQWPNPTIEADIGDRIIVNVHNFLGNETTSLHWHGLYMTDTPHMDGSVGVSQCPILPGQNFTYDFTLEQGGTYWWHSHEGGQYADGLRGALIVHDPADPHLGTYDEEYLMSISDWYNDEVPTLLTELLNTDNTGFRPPIADSALVNEASTFNYKLTPGKKYRFRLINYSALANAIVRFGGHTMSVIETDGIPVVATDTDTIFLGAGQRYSVIIEAKEDTTENFAYLVMLDMNPNYHSPQLGFVANATGILEYSGNTTTPEPVVIYQPIEVLDDSTLIPADFHPAFDFDIDFTKNFTFNLDGQGIPRAWINDQVYVDQKVPSLYTAISVGDDATDPIVYGEVNPSITDKGVVVQIILNNLTPAGHPFHLHGHHFQVIQRPGFNAGSYNGTLTVPEAPLYRDTIMVEGNSHVVLRYLANKPGAWIFHCHMEWHVHMGATSTFITAPLELQNSLTIPKEHFAICPCGHDKGNAAGNTVNPLDLSGANDKPMTPDKGAIYDPDTMVVCVNNATTTAAPTTVAPTSTASATGTGIASTGIPTTTSGFVNTTSAVPNGTISPAVTLPTGTETGTAASSTPTSLRCRAKYQAVPDWV